LNKKRFEETELHKQLTEFNALKNNELIQVFLKYEKGNLFDELKSYQVKFEDQFGQLDSSKWNTIHLNTQSTFADSYSQPNDLQAYSTQNTKFSDGLVLSIKKETAEGFQWNPQMGFVKNQFNYSSGQINSASHFEFTDGIIEAKVNINASSGLSQAIYLSSLTGTPHIELIGADKGLRALTHDSKEMKRVAFPQWFNGQWAIYRLEKNGNELIWKVNGVEVHRENITLNEPLFINIAASVQKELNASQHQLKVQWLRVLEK